MVSFLSFLKSPTISELKKNCVLFIFFLSLICTRKQAGLCFYCPRGSQNNWDAICTPICISCHRNTNTFMPNKRYDSLLQSTVFVYFSLLFVYDGSYSGIKKLSNTLPLINCIFLPLNLKELLI